jgi:HEPN domain-containing protein
MSQIDSKNYQEWIEKAKEDELNALSLLKHRDGTPSMICFISHQISEKYLKAFLIFIQKPFRKVHDLIELETLIIETEKDIAEFHEDFKLLNRYYIETRYPGDYPEFSWDEAEESYEAAKKIKEFVLNKIKNF